MIMLHNKSISWQYLITNTPSLFSVWSFYLSVFHSFTGLDCFMDIILLLKMGQSM